MKLEIRRFNLLANPNELVNCWLRCDVAVMAELLQPLIYGMNKRLSDLSDAKNNKLC